MKPPDADIHPPHVSHTGILTRERVTTMVLLLATAAAVYLCYRLVEPFLPALTWALALAVIARPIHRWVALRLRKPGLAAGASVMLVIALLLTPVVLLTWQLASQTADLIVKLQKVEQEVSDSGLDGLTERFPWLKRPLELLRQHVDVDQGLQNLPAEIGRRITNAMSSSIWGVMQLLITILVLFYLFRDEPQAIESVRGYLPLTEDETNEILTRVDDTIHATIYGTLVVAAVQGTMGGLMFWFLGLPAPLLWGFVMTLLAVVPNLGTFVVWIPVAIVLAVQGSWGKALILTAWGAIAIGLIDNLLYPLLVGRRLREHTLVAFFAIVGGLMLFGASGLVLGPVIVSTSTALIDVWWRRTTAGQAAETAAEESQPEHCRSRSEGSPFIK